jgi:hypothetical protein
MVPMPAPIFVPYPGYEMPVEEEPALARPFTLGTSILLFVGSIAVCLGVAAVLIAAGRADWSAGATAAGITALTLAFVALVVALARILLGRRARVMYALSAAMVLALMVTGLGSLSVTNPLHTLQARSLEHDGQWADAIREYSFAGQGAPNAPDIARVYDEWGEQLLGQHSYGLAATRFQTVASQYIQSGDAYERGRTDLYNTYKQWVVTGGTDVPYSTAIAYFGTYAGASSCDAACQTDAQNVEAQARFQYGTQLAASSDYAGAITQFEAIQSRFPTSVYAPQAHAAAAKAYLAQGQAAIKGGTCTGALPSYQTLASIYGDTPEGKQAKSALNAGVDVTGSISNLPTSPRPTLFLSKHIDPNNYYFSSEYITSPGTNGSFTFHGVKPGDYNLASSEDVGFTVNYVWWHDPSNNAYFIHVGQLCPVQVANLQNYP